MQGIKKTLKTDKLFKKDNTCLVEIWKPRKCIALKQFLERESG